MKSSIGKETIQRFLRKETSSVENDDILKWASASEENREELRKLHQSFYLGGLKDDMSVIDIEKAWTNIESKMSLSKMKTKVLRIDILRRIAASVLILLTLGFGSLWVNEHYFQHAGSAMIKLEAPKGEKSKVFLADGTQVWLNSETTLEYDAFDPRKVIMRGEAYFEVKKDKKHPFEVTTASGMKVTVLGTRFNLRSFSDESVVETTLEEGEVMISGIKNARSLLLKPGEQALYDFSKKEIHVKNVNTEIFSLWRNNEMSFDNISFRELVPLIERWYGVTVSLDSSLSNTDRFTMTIKTESLREFLQMMQLTSKFEYEINGEKVAIRAK